MNKVGTEAVDLYVPQEVIDTGIDVTVGSESGKAFKDNGQWYFRANTAKYVDVANRGEGLGVSG